MPGDKPIRIAIVGATGVVGQTIVQVLEERRFPVDHYIPIATEASSGREVEAFGRSWPVRTVEDVDFAGTDIAFFTAGAPVSKTLVPRAVEQGSRVVDNTTAFRMEEDVPLVVPEINGSQVGPDTKLVACPNCTAIVLVMSLAPILRAAPIRRVVLTSFQSVSGAGREALDELNEQTTADGTHEKIEVRVLPKQIAFNCIPVIGDIRESGYSKEEEKIVEETQKILGQRELHVVPTAVRVPTRVGHAISVNLELSGPIDLADAKELWKRASGVTYSDDIPTPLEVAGSDTVVVGRLRRDRTRPHALTYWTVGDNLRKGAATNSVQIAELFSP